MSSSLVPTLSVWAQRIVADARWSTPPRALAMTDWGKLLEQARKNYAEERRRRMQAEENAQKIQASLLQLTDASARLVARVKPKCPDCQCERWDAYGGCTNCGMGMACEHCGVREAPLDHKSDCPTLEKEV